MKKNNLKTSDPLNLDSVPGNDADQQGALVQM